MPGEPKGQIKSIGHIVFSIISGETIWFVYIYGDNATSTGGIVFFMPSYCKFYHKKNYTKKERFRE